MVTSQNILECLLRAVRVEIDVAENTTHKIMEVTQVGHGYSFHIFFFDGCDQITPTQKNNIIGAMPRETGWQLGVRLSIRHVLPTHLVKISNVRTLTCSDHNKTFGWWLPFESKLHSVSRSFMHPCPDNLVAIGHAVMYNAWAAAHLVQELNVGIVPLFSDTVHNIFISSWLVQEPVHTYLPV